MVCFVLQASLGIAGCEPFRECDNKLMVLLLLHISLH